MVDHLHLTACWDRAGAAAPSAIDRDRITFTRPDVHHLQAVDHPLHLDTGTDRLRHVAGAHAVPSVHQLGDGDSLDPAGQP